MLHCILVYLYTTNYLIMLFLCVFQSLCLINKSTVTSPVKTFPSLTFTGYFKSNLSFGSVLRWIVPSLSTVLLCSPFPCPFGSERLITTILGSISSDQSYRCALSWITTVISSCSSLFFFLVCFIIHNTVKFHAYDYLWYIIHFWSLSSALVNVTYTHVNSRRLIGFTTISSVTSSC